MWYQQYIEAAIVTAVGILFSVKSFAPVHVSPSQPLEWATSPWYAAYRSNLNNLPLVATARACKQGFE